MLSLYSCGLVPRRDLTIFARSTSRSDGSISRLLAAMMVAGWTSQISPLMVSSPTPLTIPSATPTRRLDIRVINSSWDKSLAVWSSPSERHIISSNRGFFRSCSRPSLFPNYLGGDTLEVFYCGLFQYPASPGLSWCVALSLLRRTDP